MFVSLPLNAVIVVIVPGLDNISYIFSLEKISDGLIDTSFPVPAPPFGPRASFPLISDRSPLSATAIEISGLGKNFNVMAGRVEDLVYSQKRLLSDVSHEIRSPLQRMGVASAILRKISGPEAEGYIDRIDIEIERIDEMVEELLELTRTATPVTRSEEVDVSGVISSIVEDAEFLCGMTDKKIETDLSELYVTGDSALLKRALGNVIHNAARHAPQGSAIEISARREGTRAVISVRDHGDGVPENELEKIFMPYYRTDTAREMSQGGVGLGLAIAKRIIERHGGVIFASNVPSGGLAVTVCLDIE
ncbi:MAG: hypothetical protein LBF92_04450 [Synergistaceae bacterium]|jgi:two-component system sensor histidine kinase CpxA|nr:hypothetical protein [Synergistaceae bacterium]